MSRYVNYDPWQTLAAAIVHQAADDYRECRHKLSAMQNDLKSVPKEEEELRERIEDLIDKEIDRKYELIDFFLSDWYAVLCDYDGEQMLERLEREKC